jgi:hypothetical protein
LIGEHTAANLSDKQGFWPTPTAGIDIRKSIAGGKSGDNFGGGVMAVM